jgi:hypothetical protein
MRRSRDKEPSTYDRPGTPGEGGTTTTTAEHLIQRIDAAAAAIESRRPVVEASMPWPLSPVFGVEPEAAWGPPEVLAHLAEMLPFWLGEAERVLAGAPEPVPFGRVASDQLRIGVIGRDRSLPPIELFGRVASGAGRWSRRLAALDDANLEKRGIHPTLGEMTVATIAERFVASHLEEHVRQLDEILGARGAPREQV